MMVEKCARCGEEGEDRRTLWMACFYAMDELDMPLGQCAVEGVYCEQTGTQVMEIVGRTHTIPVFTPIADAEPRKHRLFTLRVCKRCRGDWMGAIEEWFKRPTEADNPEADIPMRVRGATVMMTREQYDEWHEKHREKHNDSQA